MAKLSYFRVLLSNGSEFAILGYDKKDVVYDLWKLGLCIKDVKSIRRIKE